MLGRLLYLTEFFFPIPPSTKCFATLASSFHLEWGTQHVGPLVQAIDEQRRSGGDVHLPVGDGRRHPLGEWHRSAAIKLMG